MLILLLLLVVRHSDGTEALTATTTATALVTQLRLCCDDNDCSCYGRHLVARLQRCCHIAATTVL